METTPLCHFCVSLCSRWYSVGWPIGWNQIILIPILLLKVNINYILKNESIFLIFPAFNTFGMFSLAAFSFATTFVDCHMSHLATLFLCLGLGFYSAVTPGFLASSIIIAPNNAGTNKFYDCVWMWNVSNLLNWTHTFISRSYFCCQQFCCNFLTAFSPGISWMDSSRINCWRVQNDFRNRLNISSI